MPSIQSQAETSLHDQTQLLPRKKLITTFLAISLCLFVCFVDQSCISVLQPTIARDLNAQSTIAWTNTASLIANCAFTPLHGRLSDLFGRKKVLISALVMLSISDFACGFATNATSLYVFRGFAGLAGGGINSLANMIVSDVVTLQERGKYQGILGLQVGLGSALGPLIATAFAMHGSWRGVFYLLCPLILVVVGICWWTLPSNMPEVELKKTLAKVDFLGLITIVAAIILLLVPTAEGGHLGSPWTSPKIITLYIVGALLLVAFVLIEWKHAKLPMMPMSMFRNRSIVTMLLQSFLLGTVYYTYNHCLHQYLQNVRDQTPFMSAVLLIAPAITQSVISAGAGYYQSKFNRYVEIFWFGFGIWAIGGGLMLLCREETPLWYFCIVTIIMSIGMGCSFQPMLVALQAHAPKSQRAVITSFRNFLRSAGGSAGLAISSAILGQVLKASLPRHLSSVAESTFARPDSSKYAVEDEASVAAAYAAASHAVFITCVPVIGSCFLLCALIKDNGLIREDNSQVDGRPGNADTVDVRNVETGMARANRTIRFDGGLSRFEKNN